jgi:hypothetical protein
MPKTRTVRTVPSPPPKLTGLYPFAFGHAQGFGAVPRAATLERRGWVRVGEVPGLVGLWVMRRIRAD